MTTDRATNGDGRQTAGTEAGASKDSGGFDALIQEFEAKTGDSDKSGEVLKALKPVIDHVQAERVEKQEKALETELSSALDFVAKGEGLKEVPKPILRGLMEAYALEDKAFANAFQNRAQAPSEWESQLSKGRDWAQTQMKALIPDGTKKRDDLEAAKAAVAGTDNEVASSAADDDLPSSATMFNMSGSAWRRFLDEQRVKAAN